VAAVIEQDAGFGRTYPIEQQVKRGEIVIPIRADDNQSSHLIACEGRKEARADARRTSRCEKGRLCAIR